MILCYSKECPENILEIELPVDEGGQKVQTSSYKINKSWGCDVQHVDYS